MGGSSFIQWWENLCTKWKESNERDEIQREAAFILWRIWKARNDRVFNKIEWKPRDVLRKALEDANEYKDAMQDDNLEGNNYAPIRIPSSQQPTCWQVPVFPNFKMNADGASRQKDKIRGIGVIIRDEKRAFLASFAKKIEAALSA